MILCSLPSKDILRLRTTCRFFFNLVQNHASEITRSLLLRDTDFRKMHSLYKDMWVDFSNTTLDYIMALSHRFHLACSLARFLATHHLTEMFYYKSPAQLMQSKHASLRRVMVSNLRPHLMIISHMLETYKVSLAKLVQDVDLLKFESSLVSNKRVQAWRKEVGILRGYNEWEVCRTSMVFEFLKKTLFRQLRPVSYAGPVERRLRGWTKPSASDSQVMALMIFGGFDAIKKVITIQSYNMRIKALERWLKPLAPTEPPRNLQLAARNREHLLIPPTFRHSLDPEIACRMMLILPDRARFFNVWELEELTGSQIFTSDVRMTRYRRELLEFLALLRSDALDTDFELRRQEGG